MAFSPVYAVFALCQFLIGIAVTGIYVVGFVIGIELVGPKKRDMAGISICIFYALGYMVLAVLARSVDGNWRHLEFLIAMLTVPFISYYWLIPESVRWLMQQSKYHEAENILRKAAKMNKVILPDNVLEDEKKSQKKEDTTEDQIKYTMLDLLKHRNLRWRTINISFTWFANSFVYYGLSVSAGSTSDNPYVSFFLSGAVEIPAYLVTWYLLDKVGRRWIICVFMVFGGVALIATAPLSNT
ncbi:organic cation transporter protein-like, partial [Saccoglossus kowalevskii]|uniref:Organic cation transporter protein-like n=1 Tax=Saccoglossus kowalevskii TaxID=10224 RepID=A0ABM0N1H8_SACKO